MTVTVRPQAGGSGSPDPSAVPSVVVAGLTTQAEQLELYARDVRSLHEQRTALADELRRVEHKMLAAEAEQGRLRGLVEQEHERVRALEAARRAEAAKPAPAPAPRPVRIDGGRSVIAGVLVGALIVVVVGSIVATLAAQLGILPTGGDAPLVASALDRPTPAPTTPAPIVVSSLIRTAADSAPGAALAAARLNARDPDGSDAPPRCAVDLAVPALAPKVAYVVRFTQARADQASVLWPGVKGGIAVAAAGPTTPTARTPAVIPLAQ
jgi:hypothetical protein